MIAAPLVALLGAAIAAPAVVNGKPITAPEVQKALVERVRKTSFHRSLTEEELQTAWREARAALVTEELRAQEARRRGLEIDGAAAAQLAAAEEANAGGPQKFDSVLASHGIDRARYREVIERAPLAKALEESVVASVSLPTRTEAQAQYRANPKRYVVPGAVRIRELCVRVDPAATDEQSNAARDRALALRTRALAGEDFAELARACACDRFAQRGGDLGFVHRGSVEQALEDAAWALGDGAVSEPVRSLAGWHLVRREATQPERQAAFEEVETSILAELRDARRAEALRRLDEALRSKAQIVLGEAR